MEQIEKKKILFTIQWYPSQCSANALCDQSIMRALAKTGKYDISCLCYRPFGAKKRENLDSFHIYRFRRSLWWNIRTRGQSIRNAFLRGLISYTDRLVLRISQILLIPVYPNNTPYATSRFTRAAKKLMKRESFDVVIGEHNGQDSLYAAKVLKDLYPDITAIAILWDPIFGHEPAKYLPVSFANKRLEAYEQKVLQSFDRIIAMNSVAEFHREHIAGKSYYPNITYLSIPGVEPPVCPSLPVSVDGEIRAIYSGLIYSPDRDPTRLLQALGKSRYSDRIRLVFYCAGNLSGKLVKLGSDVGISVEVSGYIPKDALSREYANAHVLLNIGGPNPNMIPSKIFTYLSTGKPIISTYYIDDECSLKYLKEYENAVCVDLREDPDICARKIESFLDARLGTLVPFEKVSQQYYTNTPDAFANTVIDVIEKADSSGGL